MRKHSVIAGLLAVGAMVPLSAAAAPEHGFEEALEHSLDFAAQGIVASVDKGCLGEPGSWLPGTLQIEGQAASVGAKAANPATTDNPDAFDCALA